MRAGITAAWLGGTCRPVGARCGQAAPLCVRSNSNTGPCKLSKCGRGQAAACSCFLHARGDRCVCLSRSAASTASRARHWHTARRGPGGAPALGSVSACVVGGAAPSAATSVTSSVRARALGSASVVYMNGSNLTLRLPQAGHTSVDLYCPCARARALLCFQKDVVLIESEYIPQTRELCRRPASAGRFLERHQRGSRLMQLVTEQDAADRSLQRLLKPSHRSCCVKHSVASHRRCRAMRSAALNSDHVRGYGSRTGQAAHMPRACTWK